MSPHSSGPPPGVPPSGGNAKYAIIAIALLLGIGVIVGLRSFTSSHDAAPLPSVSITPSAEPPPNPKLEDIPPPPPPPEEQPEAGPTPHVVYAPAPSAGCAGKCGGKASPELEQALQVRGQQARRCYNQALAQDSSLKGRVEIAVRVGPSGNACTVSVASNTMATPAVANCAANIFRMSAYPAPRGGCVDYIVPLSFVAPGQ